MLDVLYFYFPWRLFRIFYFRNAMTSVSWVLGNWDLKFDYETDCLDQ